ARRLLAQGLDFEAEPLSRRSSKDDSTQIGAFDLLDGCGLVVLGGCLVAGARDLQRAHDNEPEHRPEAPDHEPGIAPAEPPLAPAVTASADEPFPSPPFLDTERGCGWAVARAS